MSANPSSTRTEGERGYVLAMTALLLVPLLVFAALAVDVGGWYSEAADAQRAADAATLAAVVHMPNETNATAAALAEAARNGYADQPGCETLPCTPTSFPQVVVTRVRDQAVRVSIITEGQVFFGGVVGLDDVQIERRATAEYILPVPLGNPTSALGTGNLFAPREGIWLAVNSYCWGRQQGDFKSSRKLGAEIDCNGADNPQYDSDGYYLVLDFPANSNGVAWNVDFYEPGSCAVGPGNTNLERAASSETGVRLATTLYRADATQFTDDDNIVPSNTYAPVSGVPGTVTSNQILFNQNAGCRGQWVTGYRIGTTEPRGRWVLNYRSLPNVNERRVNYFAVRVTPATGPLAGSVCTTLGGGATTCPRVSAKGFLSVYSTGYDSFGNTNLLNGQRAVFYLAEISQVHAGKKLEITLFDPGEGMDNLQFVTPSLTRLPFTWETIDCSEFGVCTDTNDRTGTSASCNVGTTDLVTPATGNYRCLDVSGSAYQNQTVRVSIDIPNNYTCNAGNCWWRIRYEPEGTNAPTDRTVWSVRVIGDPVRLIE